MSDEPKGLRAVPTPLLLAFVLWIAATVVNVGHRLSSEQWWESVRLPLAMEGVSFAAGALAMFGLFEMRHRLAGRAALGVHIAAWGQFAMLGWDLVFTMIAFRSDLYMDHRWLFDTSPYVFCATGLVVIVGLAVALSRQNMVLAGVTLVGGLLTWPPPILFELLYSWLPHEGKTGLVVSYGFWLARLVFVAIAIIALARGVAAEDRVTAASGLRIASKALWLRVLAAVGLVLLTLLAVAGRSKSGEDIVNLAMMAAAVINFVAFVQFGFGALRAARGAVVDLGRVALILGGAASLWAAGVTLAQLPRLYQMLYKPDSFGGNSREFATALAAVTPLVITAGIALVAIAIGGLAGRRNSELLRAHAQGKGVGFVALTLVSLAIQTWMLPKADSVGSFAMLSILAAGASLVAVAMMARLCTLGAEELELDPSLPTATVVNAP